MQNAFEKKPETGEWVRITISELIAEVFGKAPNCPNTAQKQLQASTQDRRFFCMDTPCHCQLKIEWAEDNGTYYARFKSIQGHSDSCYLPNGVSRSNPRFVGKQQHLRLENPTQQGIAQFVRTYERNPFSRICEAYIEGHTYTSLREGICYIRDMPRGSFAKGFISNYQIFKGIYGGYELTNGFIKLRFAEIMKVNDFDRPRPICIILNNNIFSKHQLEGFLDMVRYAIIGKSQLYVLGKFICYEDVWVCEIFHENLLCVLPPHENWRDL